MITLSKAIQLKNSGQHIYKVVFVTPKEVTDAMGIPEIEPRTEFFASWGGAHSASIGWAGSSSVSQVSADEYFQ